MVRFSAIPLRWRLYGK